MRKRILVVDDEISIVEAINDILTIYGYEVFTVSRGDKVFEEIVKCHPDLILMDIMLAGMDGRTICRALSAIDSTSTIPVILLTGGNYEAENTIRQSAAVDFMHKPFDMQDLLNKVENVLATA